VFTGIVNRTGIVKGISRKRDTHRLEISTKPRTDSVKEGDSLAINGTCLTLVDMKGNTLLFDIMQETFAKTSFTHLKRNDVVNVERSLGWKARVEGHFVLGHIDSVQKIKAIKKAPRPYMDVSVAKDDRMYVVRKGSVAIDGISMTVGDVFTDAIRVYIIPYTLENTNLKYKKRGGWVNIEFDILGKYIKNRQCYGKEAASAVTKGFLKDRGFI
jgi:riboflavin synthase